jgi:hypothetical protein
MSETHLYAGFRYAGGLNSIRVQRAIQRRMIRALQPRNILSVGCAQGDELSTILKGLDVLDERLSVTAIDVSDVEEVLRSHDFARELGSRLIWRRHDLLEIQRIKGFGDFDLVQCSFVLHDIPWELKDHAVSRLCECLKPGGYAIVSEMVTREEADYASEVAAIYDEFICEAEAALEDGALTEVGWNGLVGDGVAPGLLRSKAEALEGGRDFFDSEPQVIGRTTMSGLKVRRLIRNRMNERLVVIALERECSAVRQR